MTLHQFGQRGDEAAGRLDGLNCLFGRPWNLFRASTGLDQNRLARELYPPTEQKIPHHRQRHAALHSGCLVNRQSALRR
jgi:hypothetical protein